jgi:hypothetical protein
MLSFLITELLFNYVWLNPDIFRTATPPTPNNISLSSRLLFLKQTTDKDKDKDKDKHEVFNIQVGFVILCYSNFICLFLPIDTLLWSEISELINY